MYSWKSSLFLISLKPPPNPHIYNIVNYEDQIVLGTWCTEEWREK